MPRPELFEGLAGEFSEAFGNVDAVFTIAGVAGAPVRAILRRTRADDLAVEGGVGVEGTLHTLAVDAGAVPGIVSGRDTVTVGADTWGIGNRIDDGRAMMRFILDGDL